MTDFPIIPFPSAKDLNKWLAKNHAKSKGIWLRLFKKDSGVASLTRDEAIIEALCYGWIDGQANKCDEQSWLQKLTPRRAVGRLIIEGRMHRAGMKEVEAAKEDGRWDKAYDSPKNMVVPEDFLKELSKNKKAYAFFKTLNKTNTFAIAWRLQTAKKPETREKRMKALLAMLKKGEKLH
jgi:uncharacterized protein YdeI (YjbR/CyaY-like superfamily)